MSIEVTHDLFGSAPDERHFDAIALFETIESFAHRHPRRIMLDSGAFTGWRDGDALTVEQIAPAYAHFIETADGLFNEIVLINLDKLPGRPNAEPNLPEIAERPRAYLTRTQQSCASNSAREA
jgi:hypothetical protein